MPRKSKRYKNINNLRKLNEELYYWSIHRYLTEDNDPLQDEMDIDCFLLMEECKSRRYLYRSSKYRKISKHWQEYFDDQLFNDDEFREHFRLSRESFFQLYDLIKEHPSFSTKKKRRPQTSTELQLLIFLYKLSSSGTGGKFNRIAKFFKVSYGNARSCSQRVLKAVLSLEKQVVWWPSREEKQIISRRFYITYGLPNCVGIIDGTLVFLTETPEWSGEDFNTQKGGYGVNSLVVCDDHCRVLYFYIGWPGSTHDNRSWRNCKLNLQEAEFFQQLEFIIGDSAFNPSKRMVPSYKKNAGQSCLNAQNEFFNGKLSSARIKSEHCIGLLKNRFPFIRGLNVKLKKARDVKKVVKIFTACVVLHNLLLSEPDIPDEWYKACEEDIGLDVEADILYGRDVCGDDEDRREHVKHTCIELFNAAPL
jgi:hypothetical protein